MKRNLLAVCFVAAAFQVAANAQAPTITSVTNESGENFLCPGGVAFVRGTGLGTNKNIAVTVGSKQAYVLNALGASLQVELPVDAPQGATTVQAGNSAAFNITLGQYCPGIPSTNVNGVAYVYALHDSSGLPVTPAFPAIPDELVDITVTGLGPTTPPYATGNAPPDASANTNATPTVNIGGQGATVANSFLIPGDPGFYFVVARTAATLTSGNQSVTVSIGGLTSNPAFLPLTTGGAVAAITNAATYIDPSLPNGAIAQGSIAIAAGKNLGPQTLVVDKSPFQNTALSGTSVAISVGGATVAGLMYYTSFNQIAFLVPSNTPAGTGTITVTYSGQPGAPAPVTITPSNVGIFTASSDGQGAGIVTYPDYSLVSTTKAANCGGPNTTCGAANPGDVLIIWATGLGPVNGSDAAGAGLGVNMTSIPLTIWLGNVPVTASYQGRSGSNIGEDQIVFTVPANAPTGCAVPLALQIGNLISNSVAMPVAPAGTRACTPANTGFTPANVVQLSSGSGPFTFGGIDLKRNDNYPGLTDQVKGQFIRFSVPSNMQPFFFSYVDDPPAGTCQVYNNLNGSNPPLNLMSGLDAGPEVTVQAPNGSKGVSGSSGTYNGTLSATGNFFSAGTITVSAPGGADVPGFTKSVVLPAMPAMTSPAPDAPNPISVTRANGMTVTWSGGSPEVYIELDGFSATDDTYNTGASFVCTAPSAAGTFTVPPAVTLAMPVGAFGGIDFHPAVIPVPVTASGLTAGRLTLQYDSYTPLAFK